MNKYLFLLLLLFFFSQCSQNKVEQLQLEIENLSSQVSTLINENEMLRKEIVELKETDQYYYQAGSNEFSNKNFDQAIEWMNKLKLKFPTSELVLSADKLIRDSNAQIAAIYQKEKDDLNQIIRNARRSEIEDAISMLDTYVKQKHPEDLIQIAAESLKKYKDEYEKIRSVRELENSTGVRLIDYSTGWSMHTYFGGEKLFCPQIVLNFKNISGKYIYNRIKIKVDFINTGKNEMFGSDDTYLIGHDESLQPNISKSAFLYSDVGYKKEWSYYELSGLPLIEAKVYINDRFYKTFNIQKKFR